MITDPLQWQIGIVGYGEVGTLLAEDLRASGVAVSAYDIKLGGSQAVPLLAHAEQHGVSLAASAAELAAHSDLLISAVTASQTLAVAQACGGALRSGTWFLDLNSASPGTKIKAAACVDTAGGAYVEAAVMTSVPPYRIRVPLLLGGPRAAELQPLINALGFRAELASTSLGVASATKMCRSVMIKGLEAMVIESLTAARAHGVEEQVLASLAETFPGVDWEKQAGYFFQRVIQHGRRRAEEMVEAAATVREVGLEPWSARGTAQRQAWVADLKDQGLIDEAAPGDWRRSADLMLAACNGGH